jgi:hypothetical protein
MCAIIYGMLAKLRSAAVDLRHLNRSFGDQQLLKPVSEWLTCAAPPVPGLPPSRCRVNFRKQDGGEERR